MAMCIYKDCTSVQKPFCSLAFFSLPKDYRRRLWIENSGNSELATLSETARRVVCQKHFHPSSLRIQFHRTTLSRDAVPQRWDAETFNKSFDSSVEPIEITENDSPQYHGKITSENDQILPIEDEYDDDGDLNNFEMNYENHPVDETEGIEFVEIDTDDSQANVDYAIDNVVDLNNDQHTNDERIHFLEGQLPSQSPTFFHDENADVLRRTGVVSDDTSVKITEQRSNEPPVELIELCERARQNGATSSDIVVSSSTNSKSNKGPSGSMHIANEEDKYFALALTGILQRISPQKKAFAKVNILRYLTELEFGREAKIN